MIDTGCCSYNSRHTGTVNTHTNTHTRQLHTLSGKILYSYSVYKHQTVWNLTTDVRTQIFTSDKGGGTCFCPRLFVCVTFRDSTLNTANLCPVVSVVGLFYLLTVIMNFVCLFILGVDFTRRFRFCMYA